jgi:hypothetical protein
MVGSVSCGDIVDADGVSVGGVPVVCVVTCFVIYVVVCVVV